MRAKKLILICGALGLLAMASSNGAETLESVRPAFLRWAERSLHPVSDTGLDASTRDLRSVDRMIGDAKIVGLSEGIHGAAEPLNFRNRLFKHLVQHRGFTAIALESGIVESRMLNSYVTHGQGDLEAVLKQGLSNGFDTFRQNEELVRWMREYNALLPPNAVKVQIFGLDVPGSPGNFDAARGPDTAIATVIEYLRVVDPQSATEMLSRVERFLPVLKGINGYGQLSVAERDTLTAATADLVSLIERKRFVYVEKSSKGDFDWAERAAIGARQVDTWFRRMPNGWKLEDGLEWTQYAMQVRDRSMADNLEWVRSQIGRNQRVLIFAATGHLATTVVQMPGSPFRGMVPLGAYVKDRYGTDFVNILNLVVNGELKYCSATPQRVLPLKPLPVEAVENLFAGVGISRFLLDLRSAPPGVSSWLKQVHDHWNGFGEVQYATVAVFDLVYYVSPVTSACAPKSSAR